MGTYGSSPGSSQLTLFSDADKEKFTKLLTDLKGKVNSSSCIHSLPLFFLFSFCFFHPFHIRINMKKPKRGKLKIEEEKGRRQKEEQLLHEAFPN